MFDSAAEHPKGKHIKEKVLKSSVKEHVAEKLVPAEIVGEEEMQAEFVRQIYSVQGGNLLSGKEQNIYYKIYD